MLVPSALRPVREPGQPCEAGEPTDRGEITGGSSPLHESASCLEPFCSGPLSSTSVSPSKAPAIQGPRSPFHPGSPSVRRAAAIPWAKRPTTLEKVCPRVNRRRPLRRALCADAPCAPSRPCRHSEPDGASGVGRTRDRGPPAEHWQLPRHRNHIAPDSIRSRISRDSSWLGTVADPEADFRGCSLPKGPPKGSLQLRGAKLELLAPGTRLHLDVEHPRSHSYRTTMLGHFRSDNLQPARSDVGTDADPIEIQPLQRAMERSTHGLGIASLAPTGSPASTRPLIGTGTHREPLHWQ
jgi:hypothetical protein